LSENPPNRLSREVSPYLLQHAHNPVDWYPWGDEAFARAREEDKPVFLSIGYSACHWCHVMERESFEDEEVAAVLNRDFVSIKVDREERPEIDSIYMQAVQIMSGHGGWPMSVFLTPDALPFFAGTYFPPDDRHGMPSFRRVLAHVADVYRSRRDDVSRVTAEIRDSLGRSLSADAGTQTPSQDDLESAARGLAANHDSVNGGFGTAPKFPPAMTLDFLLQVAARRSDPTLLEMVTITLRKMANGGIYDQVGGGFHRYSVDARWLVPHFEKMLYDNALLARLYTRAWQYTRIPFFARIANEILGFVEREMASPDGGFYSTLDADSEGEEGKYYVWDHSEVVEVLGEEDAPYFCALYDVTDRGNWEGKNILNVPRDRETVASSLGISVAQLEDAAARGKCGLYGRRSNRGRPGRDEKIIAAWNGWMLAAFAGTAMAFDSETWRIVTKKNAGFLIDRMMEGDRLSRIHKDGVSKFGGVLEDYAGVAWGLVAAFEATQERRYLDTAHTLMKSTLARFRDPGDGTFFDTPDDHETLIARPKELFDNATPAGNSVALDVMLRLALYFGEPELDRAARRGIAAISPLAQRYPSGFGHFLGAAEWAAGKPREIVITGDPSKETFADLVRLVGRMYLPNRIFVAGNDHELPILEGKPRDRVAAYVCEGYACQAPVSSPEGLERLLGQHD